MTLLSRGQIEDALQRLGNLALQHDDAIELLAVGWARIEPFVVSGQQLKARYAFLDLWESFYAEH